MPGSISDTIFDCMLLVTGSPYCPLGNNSSREKNVYLSFFLTYFKVSLYMIRQGIPSEKWKTRELAGERRERAREKEGEEEGTAITEQERGRRHGDNRTRERKGTAIEEERQRERERRTSDRQKEGEEEGTAITEQERGRARR